MAFRQLCPFSLLKISQGPTRLQVKLTEILGSAEGDNHNTMPEDILLCGHLEIDLCAGDQTVLLDHWVDGLHPAVPEIYPGEGEMQGGTSGTHNDSVTKIFNNLLGESVLFCVETEFF